MEKACRSSIENGVKDAMLVQKRRDIGKLGRAYASVLEEEKENIKQCLSMETRWN